MERREFLTSAGVLATAGFAFAGYSDAFAQTTASSTSNANETEKMPEFQFEQVPLPYKADELAPVFSEQQVNTHYGKHHAAYFTALKELVAGKPEETMSLEQIIIESRAKGGPLFNNSAQLWNHNFFWNCFAPNGGGQPKGDLLAAINRDFGDFDKFSEEFRSKSLKQFGSGWGWLVKDEKTGKLSVITTSNAENPLGTGQKPLLTADVWEHTYYIDYLNRRADYLKAMFDKINWAFVASQF